MSTLCKLNPMRRMMPCCWVASLALAMMLCGPAPQVQGAVGDTLAVVTVPVPSPSCCGIGIAVDCEDPPNLYYTNSYDPNLHKMDSTGFDLGSVPLVDTATGAPISFGAIAWDNGRGVLWGGTDSAGSPVSVYSIDPSTGFATYLFTAVSGGFGFTDGLAYDGSDDTIYVSDDVSTVIDQHSASTGAHIRTFTPTDAGGNPLGSISGVLVGAGDLLYLGQNGAGQIIQVKKSDGSYIGQFASPGGRDEDLECDVVSFPGLTAIWSKDAYNNTVTAIEVEPDTCACGGGGELTVPFDVHPTSCPNPLNCKSQGRTPAAILGTADFDVTQIDPSTILLEGSVAPIAWNWEDVATPYEPYIGKEDCLDCTTEGPDGYLDLTLKFYTQDIFGALGSPSDGDCLVLTVTGNLLDGTPFTGEDVIVIRCRPAKGAGLSGQLP